MFSKPDIWQFDAAVARDDDLHHGTVVNSRKQTPIEGFEAFGTVRGADGKRHSGGSGRARSIVGFDDDVAQLKEGSSTTPDGCGGFEVECWQLLVERDRCSARSEP